MNRLKRFLINGTLMAGVTILVRAVSVAFNVYVSNEIGAVAMGLFSLISTVYGFALTFATSGINLATTRLVAAAIGDTAKGEELSEDVRARLRCILKKCILYALVFGFIASVALFFFAEGIGNGILGDERTVRSLRVLALTLAPIAVSCVLSGYFSAIRRVYKNAITQISAQGAKIFACIFFISSLTAKDTESACLAVVCGGAFAELLSFFVAAAMFLRDRPRSKISLSRREGGMIQRELLGCALPLALSAYMRSALVTVEHILIPYGLQKSGSTRDVSLAAYGTVGSMVFPLVLFPSAITASFASLLVPEVAESCATNDHRRIRGIVCTVLETVLIFSIGCAGVIMSFSVELGESVYPNASDVGKYLLMVSPLIPVMYLDTAVDSMLKGLGEHVYTMGVNVADALTSVILVALLLPSLGIDGYIVTVYFTEILNAALSLTRLLCKSGIRFRLFAWLVRPLLCVIGATRLSHFLLGSLLPLGGVWWRIGLSAVIYVILLTLSGSIKPRVIAKSIKYILLKA